MTLPSELKQEVDHAVTWHVAQFIFIYAFANLCFPLLLECCSRFDPSPRTNSILLKSLFVCQWVACACVVAYCMIASPLEHENPLVMARDRALRCYFMICSAIFVIFGPFAYRYLEKRGWFQDSDNCPSPEKKNL